MSSFLSEKNVGTDSFCPYGTSRLLTQFQALRTWLLSFCPYGTSRLLTRIQALRTWITIIHSPTDKINPSP
jgi:hypothetical protein